MIQKIQKYFFFCPALTFVSKAKADDCLPIEFFEEPELMINDPWLLSIDAFLILGTVGWTLYLSFFPKGKFIFPFLKRAHARKASL